jgi:inner membrane transporter RhtA
MGVERPSLPPWSLAIAAMFSVQLGSALSTHLIDTVGPAGTAWLRLTAGGIIFLAIARPPLRSLTRSDAPVLVGLGITTGLQTMAFLAAIERIPLGTSVAIEFLGPMVVAAVHSHRRRSLAWVGVAGVGVVLVTEPWRGAVNLAGVGFAALAAVGWAAYILLTKKVGERFSGVSGLALTIPIAAVVAAFVGIPQAAGHLTMEIGVAAIGLAILLPVIPYALELLALRRMPPTAFGTLMALEPAFGVVLGLLILHQRPSFAQLVGLFLVVTAGVAAQRADSRPGAPGDLERAEPSTGPSPF